LNQTVLDFLHDRVSVRWLAVQTDPPRFADGG
jgi:hypothetical protein